MKRLLIFCLLLTACQTVALELNAPKDFQAFAGDGKIYRAGDVISQSVTDLGMGFYRVHKEIVNSPEHWEALAHYSYIYYGDTEICRCDFGTVSLSPDKKTVTYREKITGAYERLNLETLQRTFIEIGPSHE